MGLFSKKETPGVSEREFLDLKSRVNNLELELDKVRSHIMSVRGRLNRKKYQEEEEEEESPEQRRINKVLLPEK
jgi:hypothetical protein